MHTWSLFFIHLCDANIVDKDDDVEEGGKDVYLPEKYAEVVVQFSSTKRNEPVAL